MSPGSPTLDLSGLWHVAVADEGLRRRFTERNFDDTGWSTLDVPGHWQRVPGLEACTGPVLHRRRFDHEVPGPGERLWLCFDGIFYQSDVWLDSTLLGDTEGYFVPHQFDATDVLAEGTEHTLALTVSCAPHPNRARKRNITGIFQHSDCFDERWNPGGLWRGVRVVRTGPVRILHSRVVCTDANRDLATVAFRLVLDSAADVDATIRTRIAGLDVQRPQRLARGENRVTWTMGIEDPDLWWPHRLGPPALHDVEIDVIDGSGAMSDGLRRRIGLRSVETRDWITRINGERIFLKGANQGPTSYWMATATPNDHRSVVGMAVESGLDMLRLQAHVSDPAFYEAADEAGLVLWQDFPLQWGYHPAIRRQAARQAREMVDLLAHHPSVSLWCAHHEPMAIDPTPARLADPAARRRLVARAAVAQQLPAYNRTIIDRSVSRAVRRCDPSRPVVSHAGGLPRLPELSGTDTHLFLGWFVGDERQLPGLAATLPRLARFLGAFGAQAPAEDFAASAGPGWPDIDWSELGRRQGLNKAAFDRYVPPDRFPTADAWVEAAQAYQATLVRYHIETLRRLKYRPAGGFALSGFADGASGVTMNVIDHARRSKPAHRALVDACRPLLPIADRLPSHVHAGEALLLDVHVVNDLRADLTGTVVAELTWPGGAWQRSWAGALPADSCSWIGTIDPVLDVDLVVGEHHAGELRLELTLEVDGEVTRSASSTAFVSDHGPHRG